MPTIWVWARAWAMRERSVMSFSVGLGCTPDGEGRAGVLQPRRAQVAAIAAPDAAVVGGAGDLPPLYNIPPFGEVF